MKTPLGGLWDLVKNQFDMRWMYVQARQTADALGKPLLNAGCGGWLYPSSGRRRAIMLSDVNLDIVPRPRVPNFVLGNVEDMSMFPDKQFGAVICSHVLEHVSNLSAARSELERVADCQFVITPRPIAPSAWMDPSHRRVFADSHGDAVLLELPHKMWRR